MDVLTRDRMRVFYPSELEWSCFYGPWVAAPLPQSDAVPGTHPQSHPYDVVSYSTYLGPTAQPPWAFVPHVVSRVLVLPPAPREYFSFRLRPLFERVINDHDASVKSVMSPVCHVTTPLETPMVSGSPVAVRWGVALHDMEVKETFCDQFVDNLHTMPMIRSLSFSNRSAWLLRCHVGWGRARRRSPCYVASYGVCVVACVGCCRA